MRFPFGEQVTFLRPTVVVDSHNDSHADWDAAARTTVDEVAIEPRPTGEFNEARNAVTSGFTLYLPPGVDVKPADRVEVRGKTYEVVGVPAAWHSPFTGWDPGVVVQTELVEG